MSKIKSLLIEETDRIIRQLQDEGCTVSWEEATELALLHIAEQMSIAIEEQENRTIH